MKLTLSLVFILCSFSLVGQNRIEILVNGSVQKIANQSIRIADPFDKIEIRIVSTRAEDLEKLPKKLQGSGCRDGEKNVPDQAQQQALDTNYKRELGSTLNGNTIAFLFQAGEVSNCPGRSFTVSIEPEPNSPITSYASFKRKYKFYLVK